MVTHRNFTIRSFAGDILSIYAFGVTAVLRANGELSKSQAKRLACQLFESDFGWTKAEAAVRVNALESAAGDEGSLFAPVIDAGGKAFLSWRSTWHIPPKLSFAEACGNLENVRSFARPIAAGSLLPAELCHGAVPAL